MKKKTYYLCYIEMELAKKGRNAGKYKRITKWKTVHGTWEDVENFLHKDGRNLELIGWDCIE